MHLLTGKAYVTALFLAPIVVSTLVTTDANNNDGND
jgi:hypothetical protein